MVDIVGFANSAPTPTTLTYNGRMLRQLNGVGMAGATALRPLGSRSGVRPGTSVTTVTATSTTWTCGPFAGAADVMIAAESGGYSFSFDAVATGAVTAANASFPRRDVIYVQIVDPENGTTTPSAVRGYLAGTVNSGGTLVIAAVPAGSFVIAEINVPIAGGAAPSVTWRPPFAVGAGADRIEASKASLDLTPGAYITERGRSIADGITYQWSGSSWDACSGPTAYGVVFPDGNGVMDVSKVQRSFDGVVMATWQQTRINATTYAAQLILGVLPVGFRPTGVSNPVGGVVTFGSGSPNQCVVGGDGSVRLTSASPAGHTIARCTLIFNIF